MNDERRKQTEQKLIESGKEEFLKKGYTKANLRDICKAAGVTTGAFYFSFKNKEALLADILDPVITDYKQMCSMKDLRNRLISRCRMHLPVIFQNLWEISQIKSLSGY